jgi:ParB family chromosome partitioning protein
MTKRKMFSISSDITQGITETINAVKNNVGSFRYEVVPLSRLETDPENPRVLSLSVEDIKYGIQATDPEYQAKQEEMNKLEQLAETIRKKGVINPVVIYKHLDRYRLVAGERRFLASLLAKKQDIQAKVLEEKPKNFDIRLLQWIENNEREDLTLKDRIYNIRMLLDEYQKEHPNSEITATLLKDLIGISLSQATCYVAVINAPSDLKAEIDNNTINNLDKAAVIAKITSESLRKQAIQQCINGSNLKELRSLNSQIRQHEPVSTLNKTGNKKPGRSLTRVNLGATKKPQVVKKIVDVFTSIPQYQHHASKFNAYDWDHYEHAAKGFKQLLQILETECEG